MELAITLKELEDYLEPLIHFGQLELKITEIKDGHRIEVYERDEYEDDDGNMVHGGDLTLPFVLYTSEAGKIGFIEHPFKSFTKANKEDVIHLINLIGAKILL